MSQQYGDNNNSNWPNEASDERSQPRYQPLNARAGRPSDWPAPDDLPPETGYIPPAQGNWGAYQPGAPTNGGGQPYNYSSYPPVSGQPYGSNNNYPFVAGQPYDYNNYPPINGQPYDYAYNNNPNPGGYYGGRQFNQGWSRRQHRHQPYGGTRYNSWTTRGMLPIPGQPLDPRQLAEQRVSRRIAFFRHLKTYLTINAILWLIAIVTLPAHIHFWPVYISLFWGMGLFFEYRRVFGQTDRQRQQMIEDEMRRIK